MAVISLQGASCSEIHSHPFNRTDDALLLPIWGLVSYLRTLELVDSGIKCPTWFPLNPLSRSPLSVTISPGLFSICSLSFPLPLKKPSSIEHYCKWRGLSLSLCAINKISLQVYFAVQRPRSWVVTTLLKMKRPCFFPLFFSSLCGHWIVSKKLQFAEDALFIHEFHPGLMREHNAI